tara:strand:- start:1834 stop:2670 length:837 start_codon:yes stop_codon:yes gene_type:complete
MEKQKTDFNFDDFLNRCVKEFCNLQMRPTIIHAGIKHYAPAGSIENIEQYKESQKHISETTKWGMPEIWKKDTSYAIIDAHRPLLLIKFGSEVYWRAVPTRDCKEAVAEAKRRSVYKKITQPNAPKQVPVKKQSVESFIERCYFECLNPDPKWETYKGSIFLTKEGKNVMLTNIWHPSAEVGNDLINELHAANIDVEPYYQSFPHMDFAKKQDWCCIEDDLTGLCIEARVGRLCYQKIVPDFLKEQMRSYARVNVRLFESPRFLFNEKSTENVWFLKH